MKLKWGEEPVSKATQSGWDSSYVLHFNLSMYQPPSTPHPPSPSTPTYYRQEMRLTIGVCVAYLGVNRGLRNSINRRISLVNLCGASN